MKKEFDKWNEKKKSLDAGAHKPPLVSEGEIWWASMGENIGSEIGGKSSLFSRPVIILKKLSHSFYFVVPTTTQDKSGSWYVKFRQHDKEMVACLHQARAIDYRRLSSRLGTLDDKDFQLVIEGFRALYIKTFPAVSGGAAGKSRM